MAKAGRSGDRGTISRLLKGDRKIDIEEISILAKFLNCSSDEIIENGGGAVVTTTRSANHHQFGDTDDGQISTDLSSYAPQQEFTAIPEVDIRAGLGGGGVAQMVNATDENGYTTEVEDLRDVWGFPNGYALQELRVDGKNARLIEVQGDSMEPTLTTGDKVMVDCSQKSPTPPGLFALWDGLGVVVKRLEHILNSDPIKIRIISDNERHSNVEELLDEVNIIGRIIWLARRV
ncbi:MAG: S24 family peptidase [Pseudomonadales bacterium]